MENTSSSNFLEPDSDSSDPYEDPLENSCSADHSGLPSNTKTGNILAHSACLCRVQEQLRDAVEYIGLLDNSIPSMHPDSGRILASFRERVRMSSNKLLQTIKSVEEDLLVANQ